MLIFLWFPNDVKANVRISFDSSPAAIRRSIYFLKIKGSRYIVLPFVSKIKFRTFYNFDLGLCQKYGIFLSRKKAKTSGQGMWSPSFKSISTSEFYDCKNESTSFVHTFFLCLSKRKEIKKFFERVDLCFDFSLFFLSFEVALLTKDGASFKFFHVPECKDKEDEVQRGRPFGLSFFDCINGPRHGFLMRCGYRLDDFKGNSDKIESVDKYFSFLYWLALSFTFCFDIMICSYLFCCIKIPIRSVFELFFLFRYLFLEKKCEELSKKYSEKNEHRGYKAADEGENDELGELLNGKQFKRDSMLATCKTFPLELLVQTLEFSIRF